LLLHNNSRQPKPQKGESILKRVMIGNTLTFSEPDGSQSSRKGRQWEYFLAPQL
jgi:hypothetical protein